jgi:alpha-L-rhamnosidase
VGRDPSKWEGELIRSHTRGRTWTPPLKLPAGILGPIKNKPLVLKDDTILAPSSVEMKLEAPGG